MIVHIVMNDNIEINVKNKTKTKKFQWLKIIVTPHNKVILPYCCILWAGNSIHCVHHKLVHQIPCPVKSMLWPWRYCPFDHVTHVILVTFISLLSFTSDAFDLNLGVGILRIKESFDVSSALNTPGFTEYVEEGKLRAADSSRKDVIKDVINHVFA